MVKTVKLTLSLPAPILQLVQRDAARRYMTPNEYLRLLITDLYAPPLSVSGHEQGGVGDGFGADRTNMSPGRAEPNKPKLVGTRSGFKGVYPYGKRWAAVISLDGKQERVAVCNTPEEAASAYDRALMARAGGDPRAAANAAAVDNLTAINVDRPYMDKLRRGEPLTDVEMAAWKRESVNAPASASSTLPVTTVSPQLDANTPFVPPVRRQLRRGSAPAIARPVDDDVSDSDDGEI